MSSVEEPRKTSLGVDNPAFQHDDPSKDPQKQAPSDGVEAEKGGNEASRQQWGSGIEFLLSCIAMSVGLGNVWRFPFTAYENGGGAFLIPYIIVLIIIGRPLYYMEMTLGQFTNRGCVKIWNMAPALQGVGYGQIVSTACVLAYYCSLMALTLFYLGASFQSTLPWAVCKDEWTDCLPAAGQGSGAPGNLTSSAELFFVKYVLNEKSDLSDGIGVPDWRLTLCLLGAWMIVFAIVIRGVKSSGKVAYFLAFFPYLVLVILLGRGASLPGAGDGVLFFITPKWEKLLDAQVWYAAVTQAFFSLNVGFGSLIVYSSYNNFKHGIYRDAMIVTTLDTFTSLLAGCTIFSILGNLAYETGQDVDNVVSSGPGLAFISYPAAIAKFDAVPQLFAVLFFLMLMTLGLGSAVALLGAIVTIITDNFPSFKMWVVYCCVGIAGFLVGLVFVTPGGQWMLNLVDHFGATYPVLALMCVEMTAVAWLYGVDNLCADIEYMLERRSGAYWRLTWGFITPVFLLAVLIYAAVEDEPIKYNGNLYPDHHYTVGWTILGLVVALCPGWAAYEVGKRWRRMSFRQAFIEAFSPSPAWGPSDPLLHADWASQRSKRQRALADQQETCGRSILRNICGCGSNPGHLTSDPPPFTSDPPPAYEKA